ncbi:MAG TPA: Crp/Fnr family transcriptional regulator [Microvirga sp.]|nr:Crp/Fnr family transcriptional regulator [Microvirga sp.]
MAASSSHDYAPLIRKLESTLQLTEAERQGIASLPLQVQSLRADQDIVRVGDRPSRSCVVLSGYTATYKVTGDGKRQIHAWHIPGDVPDLQSLHLRVLDSSIVTLTPSRVGFVTHDDLRVLCRAEPRIMEVFWRQTLIDGAIFREWMTNIGRREAYNRLAHILCEWMVRLRAVGLTDGSACELPMTQAELADAMGVTTVHVNRVLQELRADGLISLKGSRLEILDWEQLQQVADFDPTYLHQDPGEAAA